MANKKNVTIGDGEISLTPHDLGYLKDCMSDDRLIRVKDSDMVNHPNHYNSGKFEVIDIIDEFTQDFKGEMAFDMGNVIKYVLRCSKKNGVEDLKKARCYLDRVIEKWDNE